MLQTWRPVPGRLGARGCYFALCIILILQPGNVLPIQPWTGTYNVTWTLSLTWVRPLSLLTNLHLNSAAGPALVLGGPRPPCSHGMVFSSGSRPPPRSFCPSTTREPPPLLPGPHVSCLSRISFALCRQTSRSPPPRGARQGGPVLHHSVTRSALHPGPGPHRCSGCGRIGSICPGDSAVPSLLPAPWLLGGRLAPCERTGTLGPQFLEPVTRMYDFSGLLVTSFPLRALSRPPSMGGVPDASFRPTPASA